MAVLLLEDHLNRLFKGAGLHPEQLRTCGAHPEAIHEHRHLDVFMEWVSHKGCSELPHLLDVFMQLTLSLFTREEA
ncbi:hypothetical protein PC129_g11485 [Phytophthora cactorum]|uniref:Uncharacterized protein n=1 Tax=Phytophthora cactorum TaxID=29920 RepID=A0A8T1K732_9STRA|nr:hypothetical protein Pcac1_g5672 [Phytophthora cactorum]KAG2905060.1 hypothetical protein PC114_g11652 [Phytophthora cactorum]KAG2937184.1 hypothetical protein PC117_g11807 [Phytophthora cactorum]KAG3009904.1 hypothetical protein PC120_g15362 [Phytophthora cactorum]KAG3015748.1 hypothetical protein PC119_g11653 [Phytophthora cactorum]